MSADEKLQQESWGHRGRRLMAAFAVLAVAVLVMGLTFTWFVGNQSASTVAKIAKPSNLRILGPNSTAIEELDLTYDASNIDSKGKVTVLRGFCVESGGEAFELQVANTTNISHLDIKVYRVKLGGDNPDLVVDASTKWRKADEAISFTVINESGIAGIAKDPSGSNDETFGNYTNVQTNAVPLYRWASFTADQLDRDSTDSSKAADATNFIIEVSWTETVKETDIIYLIARNVSTSNNG